jgi:hypothetical protein
MDENAIPSWVAQFLNRRAAVEQEIWDCWYGRAPMPDKDKLAEWARRLGMPDEVRNG